ncbi:hypothetical protein BST43_25715 [Mycobacteroides saopaulense]|uniref:Uncharacterized protein n=1 Tax=Mycobacteroides saopaulense TaxID=1578165 RepID=A0A1X0IJH4_9MYCO|nr:hypothetical protein [Mycobacteroides saopaulense]ORB47733.1 hypothetical protein BST43_25715 [Mycobacteroides saopaulense]
MRAGCRKPHYQDIRYVPNELLSRLVGECLYAIEFVLNSYVQFKFEATPGVGHPVGLTSYVWPVIKSPEGDWYGTDLGYADAIRKLAPGTVIATTEQTGTGIRIELDTGTIVIHPRPEAVHVEIAGISGFNDGSRMFWYLGGDSFEDLA